MNSIKFLIISALLINHCVAAEIINEERIPCDSHKGILGSYIQIVRTIHDPKIVNDFISPYSAFPRGISHFDIEGDIYNRKGWAVFGMGESLIVQQEKKILCTNKIVDCIGISVWDPMSQTAALYHASKMELREQDWMFKQNFIDPLKEKIKDFSQTEINLVSCFWSEDVIKVFQLLTQSEIPISAVSIPDAVKVDKELEYNTYINKQRTPPIYIEGVPHAAMAIDTSTGKVAFKYNF